MERDRIDYPTRRHASARPSIRRYAPIAAALVIITAPVFQLGTSHAYAQVRTKRPDRGVYQPPTIAPEERISNSENPRQSREVAGKALSARPTSETIPRREGHSIREASPAPIDGSGDGVTSNQNGRFTSPSIHHAKPIRLNSSSSRRGAQTPSHDSQSSIGQRFPLMEVETETMGRHDSQLKDSPLKDFRTNSPVPQRTSRKGRPAPAATTNHTDVGPQTEAASRTHSSVSRHGDRRPFADPLALRDPPTLQPVDHQEIELVRPDGAIQPRALPEPVRQVWTEPEASWDDVELVHDATCDGCAECGLDSCDSIGCDSMGSSQHWWHPQWTNGSICFDTDRWFGGAELLMSFRKGVGIPPLVTSGPDTDPDTAGELGQADTILVVGPASILKDMQPGVRATLGTWLDPHQCRSLVARGWWVGRETFRFRASQDQIPVLARPFLNVSDNQAATQDTQLVAFPDRVSGSIEVGAENEVFGGDMAVRQYWFGKYGMTVDVLYGYQFMRMNESLSISSTSTSLNDDFAPVGSVISITDLFDVENEFHGGQFGFATRYREGCWSFQGLLKVAFGQLNRSANLSGSTTTRVDAATAVDPNGLLVRSTNAGRQDDNTFGWVPELDVSLGWQRFKNFDLTFGYHLIAMTDALQVSKAIDPTLSVNLSDPPTGQQRPQALLTYETFYVQGIHFGMHYVY